MGLEVAALEPTYNLDKVITTDTKTLSIADTVATKFATFSTTNINTMYDIILIYSYDNGVSWSDATNAVVPSTFTGRPEIQVSAYIATGTGIVNLTVYQRATINGGVNWNLLIKIAYIARFTTSSIPSSFVTTDKPLYDNALNYMKIAKEGSYSVSSSSASSTTVSHGLGYIPSALLFVEDELGNALWGYNNFGLSGSVLDAVRIDETNIYINTGFRSPTVTLTAGYKVYHEEH